jgi:dihydrofolate synthase/folylpolyglutamate synthase
MNDPGAPPDLSADVDARLAALQSLHPRVIDLSLGRIERLLDALGRPQDRLPPVVHIAGTNGKGSTLAFLRACLEAAGQQVHSYTSPHLVRFNERIGLAGAPIGDVRLLELIDAVEAANGGLPITWFEITTAIAYLAYAETPADWLLLETGLGGRLDATNVIAQPALSVITPVSLDHQGYLGDTVGLIAAEKAGILKPDVTAVIAMQPAEAAQVLRSRAAEVGAPLYATPGDWCASAGEDGFAYAGRRWSLDLPPPGIPGAHQIGNAATAVACLEMLEVPGVGAEAIARGIRAAHWPGRLQPVAGFGGVPDGWHLRVDGGHNPAAAAVLADWASEQPAPVWLVVAMLDNREAAAFLAPFAGKVAGVAAIPGSGDHAWHPPDAVARAAAGLGLAAQTAESLDAAIAAITQDQAAGAILVTGSLYLVGDVLARAGAGAF